jgi:hypothetical protein
VRGAKKSHTNTSPGALHNAVMLLVEYGVQAVVRAAAGGLGKLKP